MQKQVTLENVETPSGRGAQTAKWPRSTEGVGDEAASIVATDDCSEAAGDADGTMVARH